MVVKKFSNKQILEATKHRQVKKEGTRLRTTTRQVKDIHTAAILRKGETGRMAIFTFSTYKLPSKANANINVSVLWLGVERCSTQLKALVCIIYKTLDQLNIDVESA